MKIISMSAKFNLIGRVVTTLILLFPVISHAGQPGAHSELGQKSGVGQKSAVQNSRPFQEQPYVGGNLVLVTNDGPSGSNFNESIRGSGFVGFAFNDNFSVEGGLSQTTSTEDSDSDNTGTYEIDIASTDVFGGVRVQSNPMGIFTFFGRAGLLYYKSEIDFKESFYDLKPAGSEEEVEEGTGLYLSGGGALKIADRLKLTGELAYLKRGDYFDGSSKSFDMKEIGLSVGIVFEVF